MFHKRIKKVLKKFHDFPRTYARVMGENKNTLYPFLLFLIFKIFWQFTQFNFQNCLNNLHNLYLYIVWISEHKFSDNSNNYSYTFYCIKIQQTFVLINCYLPSSQNNRITQIIHKVNTKIIVYCIQCFSILSL